MPLRHLCPVRLGDCGLGYVVTLAMPLATLTSAYNGTLAKVQIRGCDPGHLYRSAARDLGDVLRGKLDRFACQYWWLISVAIVPGPLARMFCHHPHLLRAGA